MQTLARPGKSPLIDTMTLSQHEECRDVGSVDFSLRCSMGKIDNAYSLGAQTTPGVLAKLPVTSLPLSRVSQQRPPGVRFQLSALFYLQTCIDALGKQGRPGSIVDEASTRSIRSRLTESSILIRDPTPTRPRLPREAMRAAAARIIGG
jgi:hypothetical protein